MFRWKGGDWCLAVSGRDFFFFLGGVLVGKFWFESRIWSTSVGVSCFLLNVPCFEAAESVLIHSVRGQFGTELRFRKSSFHNLGSAGNFCFPQDLFPLQGHFPSWTTMMGGPRVTAYIVVDDWGFSRSRSCSAWSLSHLLRAILCCFVVGLLCHHIRACSPKKTTGKTQGKKVGRVKGCTFFSDVTTHHCKQILAAYMMKKYSWGLRKTMEFLSSRRPGTAIWHDSLMICIDLSHGLHWFF